MIRNSDIQFQSPEAIRAFQEERMQETIRYEPGIDYFKLVFLHDLYYRA